MPTCRPTLTREESRVRAVHDDDAPVHGELLREQTLTDVDCVNPCGTSLQQAVREAAGGSSNIDADQPPRVDSECVERALELEAPPGNVAKLLLGANDHARIDEGSRLVDALIVDQDLRREHQRLRLAARFAQPAFNQKNVDAHALGPLAHARSLEAKRTSFQGYWADAPLGGSQLCGRNLADFGSFASVAFREDCALARQNWRES